MEGRQNRRHRCRRALLPAALPLLAAAPLARAIDFRFDVATEANSADNTSYFTTSHLPALNFPSVNGHDIEQSNNKRLSTITSAGNSLGMYYNSYNTLFPNSTASQAVSSINSYLTASTRFGSSATSRWLVLNEIDAATWNGSSGDAYRTWIVDTLTGLHDLGYNNIILFSPRYLASKTYASTFQTITSYAYLGLETYLDGYTIKNSYNYSLARVQAYYQNYFNQWTSTTNGPGLSPARLFAGEHFGVYPHNYVAGQYFGSNGISGTDWQAAIEIRSIAIHNIPFGGFIGYLWQRNLLATGDDAADLAAQLSYERAYASTLTVQSEVPTWTGNDANSSWADYLNWTGGLPSTTQAPYPLLAATNPTLPRQTTANLFDTIRANTTITLDGNQSVTRLAFDSPHTYTISPGTGGTLTLTSTNGSVPSITVLQGSHKIAAPLTCASPTSLSISPGAQLDISTNTLLLSTPASTIRQYLHDAQLASSAADPTHRLGYLDSGSALTVRLALTGDANLDGQITPDDYALLDRGFATHGAYWWQGDFNYDGLINQQDYLLIDTVFGQAQGLSPGFLAMRESQFGEAYVSTLLATVPEPTPSSILYPLSSLLLLPRRRRR